MLTGILIILKKEKIPILTFPRLIQSWILSIWLNFYTKTNLLKSGAKLLKSYYKAGFDKGSIHFHK